MAWRQIGEGLRKYNERPVFYDENAGAFSIGGVDGSFDEIEFDQMFDRGLVFLSDESFAALYCSNRGFDEVCTHKQPRSNLRAIFQRPAK